MKLFASYKDLEPFNNALMAYRKERQKHLFLATITATLRMMWDPDLIKIHPLFSMDIVRLVLKYLTIEDAADLTIAFKGVRLFVKKEREEFAKKNNNQIYENTKQYLVPLNWF